MQQATDSKARAKRAEITAGIADVLLADGVAQVPLRDLAARLGTSDRMLLYYFTDKAELIVAAIGELAARLNTVLEGSRVEGRHPPAKVLLDTATFLALPDLVPFRAVWADILARGGRGEAPFAEIARALVESSIASLEARLEVEDPALRRRYAAAILAAIEGVWLLGMVAPGSTDGVTDLLGTALR